MTFKTSGIIISFIMTSPERFDISDIEVLANAYDTNERTVKRLLRAGIDPDKLDDVLDIVECLSEITPPFRDGPSQKDEVVNRVSVGAVIYAYNAANGEIEVLREIADRAHDIASEQYQTKKDADFTRPFGIFTRSMIIAIKEYQEGKVPQ